jgi:hypothetical protein
MEIERVAENIWDQLSPEARNALESLEELASRLEVFE